LQDQAINTLASWQPNLVALVEGRGSSVVISADQVQAVDDFPQTLSTAADADLLQIIANERALLLTKRIARRLDWIWLRRWLRNDRLGQIPSNPVPHAN
jgi:hypothetical protein